MSFGKVNWGPAEAEKENPNTLSKTFVELPDLQLLLEADRCIITGEKGSGKTAFRLHVEQVAAEGHFGVALVATIDFKSGDFETFERDLTNLASHTKIPPLRLLRNYWEYLFVTEACKIVGRVNPEFDDAAKKGSDALTLHFLSQDDDDPSVSTVKLGDYFRRLIEKAWTVFEEGKESSRADATNAVLRFPVTYEHFLKMRNLLDDYLLEGTNNIVITLDGFDRFIHDANQGEHVQRVFDSLMESAMDFAGSTRFGGRLVVKALVPHDRFVMNTLRDRDKLRSRQARIRWDPENLKEWTARRISLSLGYSGDFPQLWERVAPREIINPRYKIAEQTFQYILRHTMWRPRQLQSHFNAISNSARDRNSIDAHLIQRAVRDSCERLVEDFIAEYMIDHPYLEAFLARFAGRPNVMRYEELCDLVRDCIARLPDGHKWTLPTKINVLFKMGIFGLIEPVDRGNPPQDLLSRKPSVPPYVCNFYYKINEPQPILSPMDDGDEIVIHPMFFNRYRMVADRDRIVG